MTWPERLTLTLRGWLKRRARRLILANLSEIEGRGGVMAGCVRSEDEEIDEASSDRVYKSIDLMFKWFIFSAVAAALLIAVAGLVFASGGDPEDEPLERVTVACQGKLCLVPADMLYDLMNRADFAEAAAVYCNWPGFVKKEGTQ